VAHPKTPPYYDAEALPDQKWVEVSEAGEAAFRKLDAEAKT
jgi:hypothetical protein